MIRRIIATFSVAAILRTGGATGVIVQRTRDGAILFLDGWNVRVDRRVLRSRRMA